MNVLHSWPLVIGGIAVAGPVVVHFLTKPKPAPFSLSTIRFLEEIIEQRKARSRFRDILLLLLRMLCIALLAFCVARPLWQAQPIVAPQTNEETARVIVIDVSQSMAAGSGGISTWSQAKASALQYLNLAQGAAKANVIFCGAQSRPVFDQMSQNFKALREAISSAKPLSERADTRAALELANRLLAKSNSARKELVLVSDFQRSNWGTLPLNLVDRSVNVQFHGVEQTSTENLAIVAVRFRTNPMVKQNTLIEVDVANYSEQDRTVRCFAELSGVSCQLKGNVDSQATATLTAAVRFEESGWHYGSARLENNFDSLQEDDERPCSVFVRPSIQIALLSRQSPETIPSSSFYVESVLRAALGAQDQGGGVNPTQIHRIHPTRDSLSQWPQSDVFVLEHPGSLSDQTLSFIAGQMRRGKGVLYVTAELVDAVNLKKLNGILGDEFQPPVELQPSRKQRRDLFVSQASKRSGPFSNLGSNPVVAMKGVKIGGGLETAANPRGLKSEVFAQLSDTSAFVYVTSVGAGQLAVVNADFDSSNWATLPSFLPVMSDLSHGLLKGQGQQDQSATGELLVRNLPTEVVESSELTGASFEGSEPPSGDYGSWEWSASQGSMVWTWKEPVGPGVYGLNMKGMPVVCVATAAPGLESDLKTLDKEVIIDRLAAGRQAGFTTTKELAERDDSIWSWLIVACTVGLLIEIVLLRFSGM